MGHYYERGGVPRYTIATASAKAKSSSRATTIKDCRKFGWVPSVSEVQKLLSSPGLNEWKLKNAIDKAYDVYANEPGKSAESFIASVREAIGEESESITGLGTDWHDLIYNLFVGKPDTEVAPRYVAQLNKVYGHWIPIAAEYPFANMRMGYGGRIDQMIFVPDRNEIVLIDLKTKHSKIGAEIEPEDEHCMQLAAYSNGIEFPLDKKPASGWVNPDFEIPPGATFSYANLYMKTKEPVDMLKIWDMREGAKQWRIFKNLMEIWRLKNEYDPRELVQKPVAPVDTEAEDYWGKP